MLTKRLPASLSSIARRHTRYSHSTPSTLPNDGLTLHDFIAAGEESPQKVNSSKERRTGDGRLRLPEWLKRDVVVGEKDVNKLTRLKYCTLLMLFDRLNVCGWPNSCEA